MLNIQPKSRCAHAFSQLQEMLAATGHSRCDNTLSDVLYRYLAAGGKVADAPRRALRRYHVTSWHDFSGGIGRLSDHVHMLRRYLEVHQPNQRIASAPMAVKVAGRVTRVHAFWLEQSVPISVLQLSLFNETGVQ